MSCPSHAVAPQTLLAQALGWIDGQTEALGPPIRPATNCLRDPAGLSRAGRAFTRDDNPTFLQAEALLAALEGSEGLTGHAGHTLAASQMRGGFGGTLFFRVAGGEPTAHRIAASVRTIRQAISFGGLETVIEIWRGIEGSDSPTSPHLLRLSVGIPSAEDLIADLHQALVS